MRLLLAVADEGGGGEQVVKGRGGGGGGGGGRRTACGLQRVVGRGGAGVEDISDGNLLGGDVNHVGGGCAIGGLGEGARSGALAGWA